MIDIVRVGFDNPIRPLTGSQPWRLRVRKSGTGSDPRLRVELYERGSALAIVLADVSVGDAGDEGVTLEGSWDASLLSDTYGGEVEASFVIWRGDDGATVDIFSLKWPPAYAPYLTPYTAKFLTQDSFASPLSGDSSVRSVQGDGLLRVLRGDSKAKSLVGDSRVERV